MFTVRFVANLKLEGSRFPIDAHSPPENCIRAMVATTDDRARFEKQFKKVTSERD